MTFLYARENNDSDTGVYRYTVHPRQRITESFTAATCPRCSSMTIAGLWVGLRVDLEPLVLDDLGEYQAIAAGIGTWNLWPDRAARPRGVSEIRAATRTDRHARHSCDRTFGTRPRTRARDISAPTPDDPPF